MEERQSTMDPAFVATNPSRPVEDAAAASPSNGTAPTPVRVTLEMIQAQRRAVHKRNGWVTSDVPVEDDVEDASLEVRRLGSPRASVPETRRQIQARLRAAAGQRGVPPVSAPAATPAPQRRWHQVVAVPQGPPAPESRRESKQVPAPEPEPAVTAAASPLVAEPDPMAPAGDASPPAVVQEPAEMVQPPPALGRFGSGGRGTISAGSRASAGACSDWGAKGGRPITEPEAPAAAAVPVSWAVATPNQAAEPVPVGAWTRDREPDAPVPLDVSFPPVVESVPASEPVPAAEFSLPTGPSGSYWDRSRSARRPKPPTDPKTGHPRSRGRRSRPL